MLRKLIAKNEDNFLLFNEAEIPHVPGNCELSTISNPGFLRTSLATDPAILLIFLRLARDIDICESQKPEVKSKNVRRKPRGRMYRETTNKIQQRSLFDETELPPLPGKTETIMLSNNRANRGIFEVNRPLFNTLLSISKLMDQQPERMAKPKKAGSKTPGQTYGDRLAEAALN